MHDQPMARGTQWLIFGVGEASQALYRGRNGCYPIELIHVVYLHSSLHRARLAPGWHLPGAVASQLRAVASQLRAVERADDVLRGLRGASDAAAASNAWGEVVD